jgi:hypothetical protein
VKSVNRIVLFLADFLLLFVILDIIYLGTQYWYFYVSVSGASVLSYIYWYAILHNKNDVYAYEISEVTDLGNQYVNYIISYIGILLPLLLLQDYKGFVIFLILFFMVFIAYLYSDLLFYNPILTIFRYHFYEVKVKEVGQIHLISRVPVKIKQPLNMKLIVQGTYLAD